MIRKKKVREPSIREAVKKLCPDLKKEDLITAFRFNLDPEIPGKRLDGIAVADRENLTLYVDGNIDKRIPLSDTLEFKTENGVGTVFSIYKTADNVEHLLCIADMKCAKLMIDSVKLLNRICERGIGYYDIIKKHRKDIPEGEILGGRGVCPKCGRPLPRGSEKCPRCTSKFKTVKGFGE